MVQLLTPGRCLPLAFAGRSHRVLDGNGRSNHSGEHVVESAAGPGMHITAAQGNLLFTEEDVMVRITLPRLCFPTVCLAFGWGRITAARDGTVGQVPPIGEFPEDKVNTGSYGLVSRHAQSWKQVSLLAGGTATPKLPASLAAGAHKRSAPVHACAPGAYPPSTAQHPRHPCA